MTNQMIYEDYLMHIGKPKRSGRYPYGSGKRPFQGDPTKVLRARKNLVEARGKHYSALEKLIPKDYTKPKKFTAKDFNLNKITETDLTKLTLKELNEINKRAEAENKYITFFNERNPRSKQAGETVKEILSTAGAITTVTASGLGIALALKELRSAEHPQQPSQPKKVVQPDV